MYNTDVSLNRKLLLICVGTFYFFELNFRFLQNNIWFFTNRKYALNYRLLYGRTKLWIYKRELLRQNLNFGRIQERRMRVMRKNIKFLFMFYRER